MRVVYYRREDGTIRTCHSVDIVPEDELQKRIEEYNRNSRGEIATVFDLKPGSFEEYLYRRAEKTAKLQIDTLRDLEEELSSAADLVSDLIDQAKRG